MSIIKQVLTGLKNGQSIRELADMCKISTATVQRYKKLAKKDPLGFNGLLKLEDPVLNHRFNGGNPAYCDERFEDFKKRLPYFEKELQRKHVTQRLLWEEYIEEQPNGYCLSQFRFHLKQNRTAVKPSTVLKMLHQPAAKVYIDYAGDKLSYADMATGEVISVEVFAAVLPYSGYTFVTCVPSQKLEDFVDTLAKALHFFGGSPRILVPDNLKSAVIKADRADPTLSQAITQLATHYGCTVMPARSGKPQDKALVEDAVHKGYMHLYAPLRNHTFQSIEELNGAIAKLLSRYNSRRMQGCDYSRVERFLASEKKELLPLPLEQFQLKRFTSCKVAPNSFIQLGKERHHYSVPFKYSGHQVDVVYTSTQVRIFKGGECIATHIRSQRANAYTYVHEHLPSNTQAYYMYSAHYFIDKATQYGPETTRVMRELFSDTSRPEEVYFAKAQGLLKFARDTEPALFQLACQIALQYNKCNYGFIKHLIQTKCSGYLNLDQDDDSAPSTHENIRGKESFK